MVKPCVVPRCKTGKTKVPVKCSVFKVPSNIELYNKWKAVIPDIIDLKQTQDVCEKHFEDKYILRKWMKCDSNGQIIAEDMQRLLASGRIWTTFRSVREVGARCPGLLFPKTRESGFRSFKTRMSSILEKRLKDKDLIPGSFALVYRGGMDGYIHLAYSTSTLIFVSSVISLYNLFDADKPIAFPLNVWSDRLAGLQNYTQLFIVYAALFAMIFSLGSVSRKYVLRMYYNDKTRTYRVVRVGFLPTAVRTHDFRAGSLHRINKRSILPWLNIQYKHDGQKFLIFDEGFRTNADYERMFVDGYA